MARPARGTARPARKPRSKSFTKHAQSTFSLRFRGLAASPVQSHEGEPPIGRRGAIAVEQTRAITQDWSADAACGVGAYRLPPLPVI